MIRLAPKPLAEKHLFARKSLYYMAKIQVQRRCISFPSSVFYYKVDAPCPSHNILNLLTESDKL